MLTASCVAHRLENSHEPHYFTDDFVAIADSVLVLDFRRRENFDAMLDPQPVINNNRLEFRNRVKWRPVISLYLNKPELESFDTLKSKTRIEYVAFTKSND